jgi:hypothetical protein
MRQRLVDPRLLCTKHLLGEHVEHHMFVGTIRRGISLGGYLDGGLLDTRTLGTRHDELAGEMLRRGMRHNSPLASFSCPPAGAVDPFANLEELARRCPACRSRITGEAFS